MVRSTMRIRGRRERKERRENARRQRERMLAIRGPKEPKKRKKQSIMKRISARLPWTWNRPTDKYSVESVLARQNLLDSMRPGGGKHE